MPITGIGSAAEADPVTSLVATLTAAAAALAGASLTLADKGSWVTSTAFTVGDVVTQGGQRYCCRTAHTSGTFATDLAASKWVSLDAVAALAASSNLSELTSSGTARANLGLGASAVMSTAQIAADSALTGTYGKLVGANTWTGTQDFTGATVTGVGGVLENVSTVAASGATQTLPAPATATIHNITLTANCTLTFPTATAGANFTLRLLQDATGARTVTWPGTVKWPGAAAPILTTTASRQDVLSFLCIDGSTWLGFLSGLDVR